MQSTPSLGHLFAALQCSFYNAKSSITSLEVRIPRRGSSTGLSKAGRWNFAGVLREFWLPWFSIPGQNFVVHMPAQKGFKYTHYKKTFQKMHKNQSADRLHGSCLYKYPHFVPNTACIRITVSFLSPDILSFAAWTEVSEKSCILRSK